MSKTITVNGKAIEMGDLLALYETLSTAYHSYNTMIWTLPAAYIAAIVAEYEYLKDSLWALLAISIFINWPFLYAFERHVAHREVVQKALCDIEDALIHHAPIPDFSKLRGGCISATGVVRAMLWCVALGFVFFVFVQMYYKSNP